MTIASSILNGTKDFFMVVIFGINHKESQVSDEDISDYSDDQDSAGAPVENKSPLGYEVTYFSAFYLVIQGVIGTGIFATPASILKSTGSIGASYIFWVVGFLVTLIQVFMYIEYVTYFRKRSGGDVVYLEQGFPKPQFMIPVTYAAVTVILSFGTSSASAFAQYIFRAADYSPTSWQLRGLSIVPIFLSLIITGASTKLAMRVNNILGFVKVQPLMVTLSVMPS
ncbi:unnamed protein product [Ambrosiozyma monospora]|uniref:Unnamed protein product n=1 Tax=Ambrosiozyma monospora TaxID=43982 RepID=A0ACB5STB4_AMBMO|nr:unnamed protein product [Ambrosiozyma monospora]